MKAIYGVIGVIVLAVVGYFAFFYNPCKEPADIVVAVKGLQCTMQVLNKPSDQLREEFCVYLERGAGCELQEEDRPKLIEMIDKIVADCTKIELAKENYCTDKVDAMLRR